MDNIIPGSKGSKAHHLPKGGFKNPWSSFVVHGFSSVLGLLGEIDRKRAIPPTDINERLVIKMDTAALREPVPDGQCRLTWCGHASFLVQLPQCNLIFDPIFSQRCSATQWIGPKRYTQPPCELEEIKDLIDGVIISHNHYDHMDLETLKQFKKDMTYFVPLGNRKWILDNVSQDAIVHDCDWWDEFEFHGKKIICTPCQHMSARGIHDRFQTLWASWSVVDAKFRYYFAGDTGYRSIPKDCTDEDSVERCPAFKEIGNEIGPFDLACIPIGAYSPRWFMSPMHCNPEDAVLLHQDVKSKFSVAMHYGTFILTDEPNGEPEIKLKEALTKYNLSLDSFVCLKIGQSIVVKGN